MYQNRVKRDAVTGKYYCSNRKCNCLLSKKDVLREGRSRLSDEFYQSSGKRPCRVWILNMGSHERMLNYCLKYISKSDKMQDPKSIARLMCHSYKRRYIFSFGDIRKEATKVVKIQATLPFRFPCKQEGCLGQIKYEYFCFPKVEEPPDRIHIYGISKSAGGRGAIWQEMLDTIS